MFGIGQSTFISTNPLLPSTPSPPFTDIAVLEACYGRITRPRFRLSPRHFHAFGPYPSYQFHSPPFPSEFPRPLCLTPFLIPPRASPHLSLLFNICLIYSACPFRFHLPVLVPGFILA